MHRDEEQFAPLVVIIHGREFQVEFGVGFTLCATLEFEHDCRWYPQRTGTHPRHLRRENACKNYEEEEGVSGCRPFSVHIDNYTISELITMVAHENVIRELHFLVGWHT